MYQEDSDIVGESKIEDKASQWQTEIDASVSLLIVSTFCISRII